MTFLIILTAVLIFVWLYIAFLGPWLGQQYPETWGKVHTIEAALFLRSRTLLAAWALRLGGVAVMIHDALAAYGVDATPVLQELTQAVPPVYQGIVIGLVLALVGELFAWLRRKTTMPLDERSQPSA